MVTFFALFLVERNKSSSTTEEKIDVCFRRSCHETAKIVNASINFSVEPCDDFYQYACGNWLRDNPIPDTVDVYGTMNTVGDKITRKIKGLLTHQTISKIEAEDKVQMFYRSCIYEDARVEQNAIEEIRRLLENLGGWPLISDKWNLNNSNKWWEVVAGAKNKLGLNVFLATDVMPDLFNSSKFIISIQTPPPGEVRGGPIDMPHQSWKILYKTDSTEDNGRLNYVRNIICLISNDTCQSRQTEKDILEIIQIEANPLNISQQFSPAVANGIIRGDTIFHSPKILKSEEVDFKSYKMTVKTLQEKYESVDWESFLKIIFKDTSVNISQETEVLAVTDDLEKVLPTMTIYEPRSIANYIGWKVVESLIPYASTNFRNIQFDYLKQITGGQAQKERSDSCVELTTTSMGFAVSSLYASAFMGKEDIDHARKLVTSIKGGFLKTLKDNDWMDTKTKAAAIEKLNKMNENIGFPIWINDSTALNDYYRELRQPVKEEFLKNAVGAMHVNFMNKFSRLKNSVDRQNDWPVNDPMQLNAFYYPNLNSFYLVAGIMDSPLISKDNLESLNHGGIGYVIGHEMMHGFDSEGAKFDDLGNLNNWWTPEAQEHYKTRATCMSDQYSSFTEDLTSMNINGSLTLSENIADNGGIKGAYWGYKESTKDDIRLPGMEQISGDQLFFISAAQNWCTNTRTATARLLLFLDNHSPPKYRVNIPFGNSQEFIDAFKCNKDDKMNLKNKCVIF